MLSSIDIQKLNELPIEQVAQALGLSVNRHKALCPFHDDSNPSLTFSVRKNRYKCYVCGKFTVNAVADNAIVIWHHPQDGKNIC